MRSCWSTRRTRSEPREGDIVAFGGVEDEAGGTVTKHIAWAAPSSAGSASSPASPPTTPSHGRRIQLQIGCRRDRLQRRRRRDRGRAMSDFAQAPPAPHLRERDGDADRLHRPRRRHRLRRQPARPRTASATKQLKANAVTTAKIKKNAVTKAKIKAGAVDGTKVKSGGWAPPTSSSTACPTPGSRTKCGSTPISPCRRAANRPSSHCRRASYTQEAGRTDSYVGAVDVEFSSSCTDRQAAAYLLMDVPPGAKFGPTILIYAVAAGSCRGRRRAGDAPNRTSPPTRSAPGSHPARPRATHSPVLLAGKCKSGSGISAKSVSIDVIGTKKQ